MLLLYLWAEEKQVLTVKFSCYILFMWSLLFLNAGEIFETDSQYRRKTKKPPFGGSSHLIVKITHINVKLTTN